MNLLKLFVKLYQRGIRLFSRLTWGIWERLGFYIVPNHYYFPIPDSRELKKRKPWNYTYSMVGIMMNEQKQLDLLKSFEVYKSEYTPKESSFESHGDGAVLHSMVRKFKPKMIIEVGSGFSTAVSLNAAKINHKLGEDYTKIIAIEPYPSEFLRKLEKNNENLTLVEKKVENVNIKIFKNLSNNDFLFIDSTHLVTCGNDVNYLYLNVLPNLPVGVLVHIHDIRYPYEYPKEWLLKKHYFWNEQYLLQAFLTFNSSFKILWAGNYMHRKYGDELEKILSGYSKKEGWPGSFWIKRIQ